jgi:hypothetical protein
MVGQLCMEINIPPAGCCQPWCAGPIFGQFPDCGQQRTVAEHARTSARRCRPSDVRVAFFATGRRLPNAPVHRRQGSVFGSFHPGAPGACGVWLGRAFSPAHRRALRFSATDQACWFAQVFGSPTVRESRSTASGGRVCTVNAENGEGEGTNSGSLKSEQDGGQGSGRYPLERRCLKQPSSLATAERIRASRRRGTRSCGAPGHDGQAP